MTITKRAELAYRTSRFSRSWLGPLLLGLALAAASWISQPGTAAAAPSLYAVFIAMLVGTVVVASARELIDSRRESRPSADVATPSVRGPQLRRYAALLAGAGESAAALEHLPGVLEEALGIEGAALHLEQLDTISHNGERRAGVGQVAEEAAEYGRASEWMPVVVGGREIGHLELGRGPEGRGLDDDDVALATLLAAPPALLRDNGALRALIEAQGCEIESLRRRLEAETQGVIEEIRHVDGFDDIVGASTSLGAMLSLVARVAPSEVAILVTGETGTGKELVARAIHTLSSRRGGPLITVNCPAIPGTLAESELFGHERGSFTDAVVARPGQFEIADGGTILLDEIGDLPLDIQAKLLRVLQEGEVRRVGGRRPRPVNVRTLAATNRDLQALVRCGRFREDLYYRLAAAEICLPPLRERHGDVPLLASFFLRQAAAEYRRPVAAFSPEAIARLSTYAWPGNVRQLQNVVQRAVLLCPGDIVRPAELSGMGDLTEPAPATFGDAMRQEKKRRFLEALEQTSWNQSAAARMLGMSRSNFARMLRSLDISGTRREKSDEPHQ